MICFRDMTFCGSDCVNTLCRRHYGEAESQAAKRWWSGMEGDPPVAFSDFSIGCSDYTRKPPADDEQTPPSAAQAVSL